jgi:hypothetical protein
MATWAAPEPKRRTKNPTINKKRAFSTKGSFFWIQIDPASAFGPAAPAPALIPKKYYQDDDKDDEKHIHQ